MMEEEDLRLRSDRPEYEVSRTKIANLSEDDKPREKAIAHGTRNLSDAELLALLLGSGLHGKSAIDLAREILAEVNNSVVRLGKMPIMQMVRQFKGVGVAKATTIAAALELGKKAKENAEKPQSIGSAQDAYNYIRPMLESNDTEEFWIIVLTRSNKICRAECISRGGVAATYVDPKVVMKRALDNMASSIILCHNHPSGNLTPSGQDDALTKRLQQAGEILDIKVLDHIIVTDSGYYSYQKNGKM